MECRHPCSTGKKLIRNVFVARWCSTLCLQLMPFLTLVAVWASRPSWQVRKNWRKICLSLVRCTKNQHFVIVTLIACFFFASKYCLEYQICTTQSSKGQIDQHKFAAGHNSLFHFVLVWRKFWNDIIHSGAFAPFSAIEKSSRGQYVVQASIRQCFATA